MDGDRDQNRTGARDQELIADQINPHNNSNNATAEREVHRHGVNVSAVQEDGQWRIALPTNVDGQVLRQNLTQAVQHADAAKDHWPQDASQAQEHIARHVVEAMYGVKPEARAGENASDAARQAGQQQ